MKFIKIFDIPVKIKEKYSKSIDFLKIWSYIHRHEADSGIYGLPESRPGLLRGLQASFFVHLARVRRKGGLFFGGIPQVCGRRQKEPERIRRHPDGAGHGARGL